MSFHFTDVNINVVYSIGKFVGKCFTYEPLTLHMTLLTTNLQHLASTASNPSLVRVGFLEFVSEYFDLRNIFHLLFHSSNQPTLTFAVYENDETLRLQVPLKLTS